MTDELLLGLTAVLLSPSLASACTCLLNPNPCNRAWGSGEVIFLAKVLSVVNASEPPPSDGRPLFLMSKAVHLQVAESFRGAIVAGGETVIFTGSGGGDCGYPFSVGTSYLIFANSSNGRMTTSICSETAPEVMEGGTLRALRSLRDSGRSDDLFGTVGIAPRGSGFGDLVEVQPLALVKVQAIRSNGERFSTTTDEHGAYGFPFLPLGQYQIEEELPKGLEKRPVSIDLSPAPPAIGCRFDVFARPDGRISGMVIDTRTGRPLTGFVTLEPAGQQEPLAARKRGGLPGDDAQDGSGTFSLEHLPPGRYRLTFVPKIGGILRVKVKYYWPSASTASDGGIDVALGQHVENVRFEVSLSGPTQ
jgi:hypothetical protein